MTRVKGRRSYSSPLREQQSAATRRAILDAAQRLFVDQGYVATTIEQIADCAGVSKPTVFNTVGNKATLLRVVRDVALAGDDDPVPVAQPELPTRAANAPDQRTAVELLAQHLAAVGERYGPLYEVLHAAAFDPELAELWATEERERLIGARHWVRVLRSRGALRPGVTTDHAVDVLWFLMAPGNYVRLAAGRRWSRPRYQRWLATSIESLLLA